MKEVAAQETCLPSEDWHVPLRLSSCCEPVLNPVWSWLVHGERPSVLVASGGALLILVLLARARMRLT